MADTPDHDTKPTDEDQPQKQLTDGGTSTATTSGPIRDPTMVKQAVHEMDQHRCVNCLGPREVVDLLDVDHTVPRGVGGSERYTNLHTLCRDCHSAKHGDGIAPTVEFSSTGRMSEVEFYWY